ncbi:MAG: Glu-tRNA(Gln) amidotransferase GatDE subunit E [Thermoplasmata archaeon]|nr:MAG: Glu-tRNA(Gln) amidotransferase GatDE subunit E [Thermoplasmata archaeon]
MDYKKLGFKAGLEIHQQLDTHKLFCGCPSVITEDIDYFFERVLRPTQSELGDIDKAALLEAKRKRRFLYTASERSTCLVEADEEPPHLANREAVDIVLTIALMINARIVDEIHFMRKIVIDGSNTSGFQRTALVAVNGRIKDVCIPTIALEEDAARKIKEEKNLVNYGLDRLGIPLVEVATDASIKNPGHAREVAEYIGSIFQSTGRVKRGLGTIRQDLNVSIKNGARVEIKGVQSLSAISRVLEKEVLRQLDLIKIKEILQERKITREKILNSKVLEITDVLRRADSRIVKKSLEKGDSIALAVLLPGFRGLLKLGNSRFGKELATHAKIASGIGGLIHTDELPGYGISEEIVEEISKRLKLKKDDAFAICIGKKDVLKKAVEVIKDRAAKALDGVLEEVRRALPDDTTEYMRPLPGAARMYPETDVPPIRVKKDYLDKLRKNLPELPEKKLERLKRRYVLNEEQIKQILLAGYEKDFEFIVKKFPKFENIVARTILNTIPELEKEGVDAEKINLDMLLNVFSALKEGKFAKEGIPELLRYLSSNPRCSIDRAIKDCGLARIDLREVEKLIEDIVSSRKDFITQRGVENSFNPIMGLVMQRLRGKVDGKLISDILKKKLEELF